MFDGKGLHLVYNLYDIVFCFDYNQDTYTTYKNNVDKHGMLSKSGKTSLLLERFSTLFVQYEDASFFLEHINTTKSSTFDIRLFEKDDYNWFRVDTVFDSDTNNKLVLFHNIDEQKRKELQMIETIQSEMYLTEAASKTKSIFLARMSHDMRTPMNGIIGMAEIARRDLSNKETIIDCLDKIDASGRLLLSLINDILDYSRIGQSSEKVVKEVFDIKELMNSIIEMFQAQIEKRQLCVTTDYSKLKNPIVQTDFYKLKRILMNVVSNAVKFSRDTITVCIADVYSVYSNYLHYSIVIDDNGIGMSKEFIERLYRPFEREEKNLLNQIEGTGMGMAITKNLVSLLNGNIYVESTENVGTAFTLSFDFVNKDAKNVIVEQDKDTDYDFSGKRILIAEDNSINAEILQTYLLWSNATVDVAVDGIQAVDMYMQKDYDLILMDIQMPLMDGYEAAKRIRSSSKSNANSVVILALTANAFAEDKEKAKLIGMNNYITKPVDFKLLQKTLAGYLLK